MMQPPPNLTVPSTPSSPDAAHTQAAPPPTTLTPPPPTPPVHPSPSTPPLPTSPAPIPSPSSYDLATLSHLLHPPVPLLLPLSLSSPSLYARLLHHDQHPPAHYHPALHSTVADSVSLTSPLFPSPSLLLSRMSHADLLRLHLTDLLLLTSALISSLSPPPSSHPPPHLLPLPPHPRLSLSLLHPPPPHLPPHR